MEPKRFNSLTLAGFSRLFLWMLVQSQQQNVSRVLRVFCVCIWVESRIWWANYYSFVTWFSAWRVPAVRNTERLLWLNSLLSQSESSKKQKKYTHNPWLEIKSLKLLYASFLSWPAMRRQNSLGFFTIFKIRSLMINLVPDVLACKTTAENTAEKKILNRLIFCLFFFFSMFC